MSWLLTETRSQWIIALALIAKTPTLTSPSEISHHAYKYISSRLSIPTPSDSDLTQSQKRAKLNPDVAKATTEQFSPTPALALQKPAEQPTLQPTTTTNKNLFASGIPTQYGGLGYLLNALEQLNFPFYLSRYSQPNTFTYRLLNYIAKRYRYSLIQRGFTSGSDEKIFRVLEVTQPEVDLLLGGVTAGGGGSDDLSYPANLTLCEPDRLHPKPMQSPTDSLCDLLTPPAYLSDQKETASMPYPFNLISAGSPYCPYRAWHHALRTYLYRNTGLSLAAVIHRPARFRLTASHFDITFPLDQVDIRLRRSGLDLNPGWIPWFGRVVQFHYQKQL